MNREKRKNLPKVTELVLSTGDGMRIQAAQTEVNTPSTFSSLWHAYQYKILGGGS